MNSGKGIIIVGGGWSGLACAVELTRLNHRVHLLEMARQLGGRARRVAFGDQAVDNGHHVIVGAYRATLGLLNDIGVDSEAAFTRKPFALEIGYCDGTAFSLRAPQLPAPLHILAAIINSRGFRLRDRLRALRFGSRVYFNKLRLSEDISVAELLRRERQTDNLITVLWQPLCLKALNTPIEDASATIFINMLHEAFCRKRQDSDILLANMDLAGMVSQPALDYIEKHGGTVSLDQTITTLEIQQEQILGVRVDDKLLEAEHVVLAVPPQGAQLLLQPHPPLHDIAYNLSGFSYEPICTVYLQYPRSVRPDAPIQGLLGTTAQWVLDRRFAGNPGVIAININSRGAHMEWDEATLVSQLKQELHQCFPHWPHPEDTLVIREDNAVFSARVGIDRLRPQQATPVSGLWLAGDYTYRGYPATLESAVRSGYRCAEHIHRAIDEDQDDINNDKPA
jgi:squalene-associated FAD-dependent desaturase